jgi:hypothetical protein
LVAFTGNLLWGKKEKFGMAHNMWRADGSLSREWHNDSFPLKSSFWLDFCNGVGLTRRPPTNRIFVVRHCEIDASDVRLHV